MGTYSWDFGFISDACTCESKLGHNG